MWCIIHPNWPLMFFLCLTITTLIWHHSWRWFSRTCTLADLIMEHRAWVLINLGDKCNVANPQKLWGWWLSALWLRVSAIVSTHVAAHTEHTMRSSQQLLQQPLQRRSHCVVTACNRCISDQRSAHGKLTVSYLGAKNLHKMLFDSLYLTPKF